MQGDSSNISFDGQIVEECGDGEILNKSIGFLCNLYLNLKEPEEVEVIQEAVSDAEEDAKEEEDNRGAEEGQNLP